MMLIQLCRYENRIDAMDVLYNFFFVSHILGYECEIHSLKFKNKI